GGGGQAGQALCPPRTYPPHRRPGHREFGARHRCGSVLRGTVHCRPRPHRQGQARRGGDPQRRPCHGAGTGCGDARKLRRRPRGASARRERQGVAMQDMIRRYGPGLTLIICLLVAFWLVMLVIVPNITLLEQSFRPYLPVAEIGGPRDTYSLGNYMKVL